MPNVNEYMLKQADAETIYQKKLNAGTGINIDPITDTISATGSGGSTVTYTPSITTGIILGVLGINGTSNPIKSPSLIAGQNVSITQDQTTGALTFSSVNTTYNDMVGADGTNAGTHGLAPAPTATDNTKFLKGDGSWGDPVTANPVATATATLTKLSINNTVYDLAGGTATYLGTTDPSNATGNNGDLYFKYVATPATIEDEVTLPTFVDDQSTHITVSNFEDYTDVSFGYIDIYSNPGTKDFTIEDLPQNNDPQWNQGGDIYILNSYHYVVASRDSTGFWIKECGNLLQSITISYLGYTYSIVATYVKVEGRWITFSTGGGSTVNDVEVDGVSVVTGGVAEIDLTGKQDALSAGDNITFNGSTISALNTTYSAGDNVLINASNVISALNTTYSDFSGFAHGLVPSVSTASGKYLKDNGTWDTPSGGGGSSVIANPSGTPTDTLQTVEIDGTIYEIEGGGSSYNENVLYTNSGTTAGNITLSSAYTDYDMLYFDIRRSADNTNYQVPYAYLTSEMIIGEDFQVFGYNEYISYDITSTTEFTKLNNGGAWYIYKIVGIKFGSSSGGGGGGSFVGLTKNEYDALPLADKEDTTKMYLVQEGGGIPIEEDLIQTSDDWVVTTEGNTITWTNNTIVFHWSGYTSIGNNTVKKVAIPANVTKIKFKITTGSRAYSTTIDRFRVFIGVRTTYQTGIILPYYSTTDWLASDDFATKDAVWEDELDLSNINVDTYLYIIAHGWDLTVNELTMEVPSSTTITHHTYWNNSKWSQWNQVKELTQAEYNALTTAEKQDGSIYMTHDDGYKFISYNNDQIVVRVNTNTGETLWFFNGWIKSTTADVDIPAELISYLPDHTTSTQVIQAKAWTDSTSTTTNGWVGFVYPGTSSVKLRAWSTNFSSLISGTFWAVLDINGSSAEGGQTANYSAPTEGLSLLPNRIYYNNTLYANNAEGGSGGGSFINLYTASSETAPNTITLNDDITNYDMVVINISPATASISTLAMTSSNYIVDALVSGCIIGAFAGSNHAWYNYTNSTTLTKYATAGNYYIKSIVGIKY